MGWMAEKSLFKFNSWHMENIFLFLTVSVVALELYYLGGGGALSLFLGVNWLRHEADYPPPSYSTEVKNTWLYTSLLHASSWCKA
jgi:hypothetical protein